MFPGLAEKIVKHFNLLIDSLMKYVMGDVSLFNPVIHGKNPTGSCVGAGG